MAKKGKKTKKKCCEKYIKKGVNCSKCPIVGDLLLTGKKADKKKKGGKKGKKKDATKKKGKK